LVKKFETHGTCGDRRVTGSSPSGPPITIRTPDNRPIYMVVLASAVEGSFDVKRAQCN